MGNQQNKGEKKELSAKTKLVFMGKPGSGKTAILNSYQSCAFNPGYEPSTGSHLISLPVLFNGDVHQLLVMDSLADNDLELSCRLKCIQNTEILAILFDLSDEDALHDIKDKVKLVKDNFYQQSHLILVGNKMDLEHKISTQDIQDFMKSCEDYQIDYFSVSAKTGENIITFFTRALELGYCTSKPRWDKIKLVLFTYKYSLPQESTEFAWGNLCEVIPNLMKKKRKPSVSISKFPLEALKRLFLYI